MRSKELVAYTAAFTGPLAGNAVLALLTTLGTEWNISAETVLLTIPVFMFPFAIAQLFSGTISDAYDRRSTVSAGLLVYALGSFVAAAAPSFGVFMASRFVQGIGYAFVSPVLVAVLSDIAGPSRQGLSMGYYGSFTSAGVASGPLLAGTMSLIDWRLTFLAIGLISAIALALFLLVFEKDRTVKSPATLKAIGKQLSATVGNRGVAALSASGFLAFLAQIGMMSFVSDHLGSGDMQVSALQIGVALGLSGILGILVSPVSGKLVDAKGARYCVTVGFVILASGTVLFALSSQYWQFVVLLAAVGTGTTFMWSSLLTMVVRAYPALKGTSSSVFNSARFTGYAVSPLVLTPVNVAWGFSAVMITASFLCIVALALALSSDRSVGRE